MYRLLLPALCCALLLGCQTAPTDDDGAVLKPPVDEVDPMVSVDTLHPAPEDYARSRIGTDPWIIPPYARYLEGVKICLDPGHGGDAHKRGYKRGPTGVREAEMNLRVGKYLRDLLEAAGAEAKLTREADVASSLKQRAEVANEWGADIFVSLHHNAIGKPNVNRTTVWHHKGVDYRPSNVDLARYLCLGLYDSIMLEQITGDALKSDQLMYEGGFGILRHAKVTAALTESSFFTQPEEEQRLRDPAYNLLEAYGLFLGLAKYAAAGLPRATLVEPADGVLPLVVDEDVPPKLVFELDDGLRSRGAWGAGRQMILTDSVAVRVNGELVHYAFSDDGKKYRLEVPLEGMELNEGDNRVEVQFINKWKNSVLNPHHTFRLGM
jgi:N-acetylmuramoyl-L-alanine amidase